MANEQCERGANVTLSSGGLKRMTLSTLESRVERREKTFILCVWGEFRGFSDGGAERKECFQLKRKK